MLLLAAVLLFVAVSEVSAQEPPDLDGSLGYDSFTTCWRIGVDSRGWSKVPPLYGSGYDWMWPGCSSPGDPDQSCGPASGGSSGGAFGSLENPEGLPLSGAAPGSFFSIFPANLDAVLSASGADAVAYIPAPVEDEDFVYRTSYRQPVVPPSVNTPAVPPAVSTEVDKRNCFVDLDLDLDLESRLSSTCEDGIPVFHSRRDYLNMLYGVVDDEGQTGYANAVQEERPATSYKLWSLFSYYGKNDVTPIPGSTLEPVLAPPWWSNPDSWQRVPAREAAKFKLGWLHPDFPQGGLSVDYAYLLRQQHYMNAELLSNLRSYSTDGSRVTRGIRSSPHAWVFNGLVSITCSTGSTCVLSVDMNQVAVRQINVVYLEVDFNPAFNRAESGVGDPHRLLVGQSPAGHSPPTPFDGEVPTHTPGGVGPNDDLLGDQSYPPEYYYYDIRSVRHPAFVEDLATAPYDRMQAGQLAGTRALQFIDRDVYPTPDDVIFDHGHVSDTDYVGFIKDYPDTKYDSLVVQMELSSLYRQDPVVDYSAFGARGAGPNRVSLFGGEHGEPILRDRIRPTIPGVNYSDIEGLDAVAAYEQVSIPAAPNADVFPFGDWISSWPEQGPTGCVGDLPADYPFEHQLSVGETGYDEVLDLPQVAGLFPMEDFCTSAVGGDYLGPHYVQDAFWFRWPVMYSDVAWYLFELDEFNKAVADDSDAIEGVIGHSGMGRDWTTGKYAGVQPAYQLDPSMMAYSGLSTPTSYDVSPLVPHRWLPGMDAWGDVDEHLYTLLDNHRNTVAVVEVDRLREHVGDPTTTAGQARVAAIPGVTGIPDWIAEVTRVAGGGWQDSDLVFGGRVMGYEGAASSWRSVYYQNIIGQHDYRYGVFRGVAVERRPGGGGTPTPEPIAQGGQRAYHGMSFVPMRTPLWNTDILVPATPVRTPVFYDPGGVLVKRGVAGVMDPGKNSRAEWHISDGQSFAVSGEPHVGIDDRIRLGLAEPGSHYAYRQAIQWPDLGINPNRSHLLVTLYYEAKAGDPFYLVRRASSPSESDVSYSAVGAVPRIQMRPVMCRTFVQPLGVNQGPREWWDSATDWVGDRFNDVRRKPQYLLAGPSTWVAIGAWKGLGWGKDKAIDEITEYGETTVGDQVDRLRRWIVDQGEKASHITGEQTAEASCVVLSSSDDAVTSRQSGARARSSEKKEELLDKCAENAAIREQSRVSCISTSEGGDGECVTIPVMALRIADVRYDGGPVTVTPVTNPLEPLRNTGYYYRFHYYQGQFANPVHPRIVRHTFTKAGEPPVYGWDVFPNIPTSSTDLATSCPPYTPQPFKLPGVSYTPSEMLSGNYDPGALPQRWVQGLYNSGLCRPFFVQIRCDLSTSDVGAYGRAPGGECLSDLSGPVDPPLTAVLAWDPLSVAPVDDRHSDEEYYQFEFTLPPDVGGHNFDNRRYRGVEFGRISQDGLLGPGSTGWAHSGQYVSGGVVGPVARPSASTTYRGLGEYAVTTGKETHKTYLLPADWQRLSPITGKADNVRADRLPIGHLGALSANAFTSSYSGTVVYDTCQDAINGSIPAVGTDTSSGLIDPANACADLVNIFLFDADNQVPRRQHWYQPQYLFSGPHVHTSFRSMYYDLMHTMPLYGDLTYGVRMRPVYDDGERVKYGDWSETLEVSPRTMCPLVHPETQAVAWRDLGCERYSDSGALELSTSGDAILGYTWFWSMLGSDLCTSWFDSTPANFTWGHPVVVRGWSVMWVLSVSLLALMIFWQGIRMTYDMWLHGGWTSQRDPGFREMVPRFILAIILSAASLWICRLVLVLISHISCYISRSLDVGVWEVVAAFVISLLLYLTLVVAGVAAGGIAGLFVMLAFLLVLCGFFLVIFGKLIFQLILRLALLSVLVVLSPLAFMLLATPDTEGQFKKWLDMFVTTMVTQSVQLITLFVGFEVFEYYTIGDGGIGFGDLFTQIVGMIMALSVLYLATVVPTLMDRWLGREFSSGGQVVEQSVSAAGSAARRS